MPSIKPSIIAAHPGAILQRHPKRLFTALFRSEFLSHVMAELRELAKIGPGFYTRATDPEGTEDEGKV